MSRRGVFLSYSRADQDFASELRAKLAAEAPDVGVIWQDRANLTNAVQFTSSA